jgi:hypothetical protein
MVEIEASAGPLKPASINERRASPHLVIAFGGRATLCQPPGSHLLRETFAVTDPDISTFSDEFSTAVHSLPQISFWYCLPISDSAVVLPQHAETACVGDPGKAGGVMHHTDCVAEFRAKLVSDHGLLCRKDDGDETSPLVKRWLMLADQLLSTDAAEIEPA